MGVGVGLAVGLGVTVGVGVWVGDVAGDEQPKKRSTSRHIDNETRVDLSMIHRRPFCSLITVIRLTTNPVVMTPDLPTVKRLQIELRPSHERQIGERVIIEESRFTPP